MNKETLRILQTRLNGLASLLSAAEMDLIELDETALQNACDSAQMIVYDFEEEIARIEEQQ